MLMDYASQSDGVESPLPRKSGIWPLGITMAGLAIALYLLWDMRADFSYWMGLAPPVDLGAAGAYHPERAADDIPAQVSGKPSVTADRYSRWGKRYEIVAVRGTNLLVRRELKGLGSRESVGRNEPGPSQASFSARGRLVVDAKAPFYEHAFRSLAESGAAQPVNGHLFLLLDGEMPRKGWQTPAIFIGLLGLSGINIWTMVRFFWKRRQAE